MLVTADNLVQLFSAGGVGLASYLLIGFGMRSPPPMPPRSKPSSSTVSVISALRSAFSWLRADPVGEASIRFAAAPGLAHKTIHIFGLDMDALTITCCFSSWGDGKNRRSSCCTPGCPMPWRANPGVGAHSCGDHGDRGRLHGRASLAAFRTVPSGATFVTIIGATTAFFAATIGLVQNDIKRVIAYSTCSQLGYMFVGLASAAIRLASSICSRMPSSRRFCSSAPDPSSSRCITSRTAQHGGALGGRFPSPSP